jgi:hypothetical protein
VSQEAEAPEPKGRDPFFLYASLVTLIGSLGVLVAYYLPKDQLIRWGGFIGVSAAVFSGAVALPLKQRAVAKSLKAAMGVLGVVFGVRLVLLAAGLLFVRFRGYSPVAFVVGFFGVYFALQWVEISYVLAEHKRRSSK